MSNEKWMPVVGFEGKYEVSNLGRIKSLNYRSVTGVKKILIPYTDKNNHWYHKYTLVNKDGNVVTKLVHWLVMEAFIGQRDGKFIDHIDGNGSNNRLDNLRYCTHRENLTFDNVVFKKKRSSKYTGVSYRTHSNGKNKWRALIQIDKKKFSLGAFATEIEASNAYQNKLKEIL